MFMVALTTLRGLPRGECRSGECVWGFVYLQRMNMGSCISPAPLLWCTAGGDGPTHVHPKYLPAKGLSG